MLVHSQSCRSLGRAGARPAALLPKAEGALARHQKARPCIARGPRTMPSSARESKPGASLPWQDQAFEAFKQERKRQKAKGGKVRRDTDETDTRRRCGLVFFFVGGARAERVGETFPNRQVQCGVLLKTSPFFPTLPQTQQTQQMADRAAPLSFARLHGGYHKQGLRAIQACEATITPANLMYPLFIRSGLENDEYKCV